ncbi:MAG: YlzJ-like family protein [Thermaerobacter sp.]|nr:hypothetical protein [Bacillota bacterium]REJ36817.1 MAG: hypothetical protein DIU84_05330 [Bacillota bacterium]
MGGPGIHWDGIPLAVIWTVADPGLVWGGAAPEPLREAAWQGRRVLLRRDPEGWDRVERVLSPDPEDFLDPRLAPGALWPPDLR